MDVADPERRLEVKVLSDIRLSIRLHISDQYDELRLVRRERLLSTLYM